MANFKSMIEEIRMKLIDLRDKEEKTEKGLGKERKYLRDLGENPSIDQLDKAIIGFSNLVRQAAELAKEIEDIENLGLQVEDNLAGNDKSLTEDEASVVLNEINEIDAESDEFIEEVQILNKEGRQLESKSDQLTGSQRERLRKALNTLDKLNSAEKDIDKKEEVMLTRRKFVKAASAASVAGLVGGTKRNDIVAGRGCARVDSDLDIAIYHARERSESGIKELVNYVNQNFGKLGLEAKYRGIPKNTKNWLSPDNPGRDPRKEAKYSNLLVSFPENRYRDDSDLLGAAEKGGPECEGRPDVTGSSASEIYKLEKDGLARAKEAEPVYQYNISSRQDQVERQNWPLATIALHEIAHNFGIPHVTDLKVRGDKILVPIMAQGYEMIQLSQILEGNDRNFKVFYLTRFTDRELDEIRNKIS